MSSLNNIIAWQKRLHVQKEKAKVRGNKKSEKGYNKLIKNYNGLIRKKQGKINEATLAQLEKDAADSVNAIEAPNNISPAMKQQLNEFRKHANTAKKINNLLARPFNTSKTRHRRRPKRQRTRNNNNNNSNRGNNNTTCKERTKNGVCILSGTATGAAVGASYGGIPGACVGAACGQPSKSCSRSRCCNWTKISWR